jgi:hypothetical protein
MEPIEPPWQAIKEWIPDSGCHEVHHRQFVFTTPKVLRGIFRKRRRLPHHHLPRQCRGNLYAPPISHRQPDMASLGQRIHGFTGVFEKHPPKNLYSSQLSL